MVEVTDAQLAGIVGAFQEPDVAVFRVLLDATAEHLRGDLAELGVLYGRSAVLIGSSLRPGEVLTVVDLFGEDPGDDHNRAENDASYPGLTRAKFEENYRRVLGDLPVVVHGPSESVVEHARHGTHRFVHVDASHLHEHVARDIEAARVLLAPDGVLVLDDIRQEHTPGVAAAAWQAVLTSDLRPFAISPNKLYATWGDGSRWQRVVEDWAAEQVWTVEHQVVNGHDLLRLGTPPRSALVPPDHPARRFVPPVLWPAARRLGARAGMAVGAGRARGAR